MRTSARVKLGVAAAVALGLGLFVPAAPAVAAPNFTDATVRECLDAGNVWVVVDFSGGRVEGGCATEFATGAAAIQSAGFTVNSTSFVTTINGVRADYVQDQKWWTYWHKTYDPVTGCAAWEFSNQGLGEYAPAPGSIEGWSISPAAGANVPPSWNCVTAKITATAGSTSPVGQQTNVTGKVSAAPTSAKVWTQVMVNGAWSTSQTGTTDASGNYVLPLTYGAGTPGTYTYRVGVEANGTTVYSDQFTLTRTAVARVTAATAGTKPIGQTTNVWGTTGLPNARVWTQVMVNGAWSTSQIGTTNATGNYVLPLTYGAGTPGTYTYRVGVEANGTTVYSDQFTLTRTAVARVTAATAGTKPIGQTTNVWGTTGLPNARVWTQVMVNGAWSTSQIGTTNATGNYVLPLTYGAGTPGTYTYRVAVALGSQVTYSAPFTLTRT